MSHPHLTLEERVSIEIFVSMGMSCREMARRLGRSHSTVSRELRRNAGSAKKGYRAQSAERHAHKRRRRQARYGQGRRLFPGRIDISQRPGIVAGRTRFGDWEADLFCASKGKAALLTCNERKSRFLLLAMAQDKTAASFNAGLISCLRAVPSKLRQTLTLDNGSEMAGFRALEAATGLRTYFCKPHAPWQRGTNENSNGLLRQYFPRGISFHKITEKMISDAAEQLNNRPRKCLHYQTPAEVFNQALTGAFAI